MKLSEDECPPEAHSEDKLAWNASVLQTVWVCTSHSLLPPNILMQTFLNAHQHASQNAFSFAVLCKNAVSLDGRKRKKKPTYASACMAEV